MAGPHGSVMSGSASASWAMQQAQPERGSLEPAKVMELPNRMSSLDLSLAGLEEVVGHVIGRLAPVSRGAIADDTGRTTPPCHTHMGAQLAELENRVLVLRDRLSAALELLELP